MSLSCSWSTRLAVESLTTRCVTAVMWRCRRNFPRFKLLNHFIFVSELCVFFSELCVCFSELCVSFSELHVFFSVLFLQFLEQLLQLLHLLQHLVVKII